MLLHTRRNRKIKTKLGDTLIEVTLAIGIFSLVAVAIVSVVSTSTSSAQVALESTLAREEIDNQAEALRFIQSSYVNSAVYSKPDEDSEYQDLWKAITDNAKTKEQVTDDILLFHPSTCDELYEGGNLINQSAFIINTRNLGSEDVDQIVLPAKTASVFYPAETYPHLVYGTLQDDQPLYDESDEETNLLRASGIYVIAVKDPDSTNIVSGNVRKVSKGAAYYDFYIRACWYAPGAEQPTTISTVIRLYDPGAIEVKGPTLTYKVVFKPNGASATDKTQTIERDEPTNLTANTFTRSGYTFKGWNTKADGTGTNYIDKAQVNNLAEANGSISLFAQWEETVHSTETTLASSAVFSYIYYTNDPAADTIWSDGQQHTFAYWNPRTYNSYGTNRWHLGFGGFIDNNHDTIQEHSAVLYLERSNPGTKVVYYVDSDSMDTYSNRRKIAAHKENMFLYVYTCNNILGKTEEEAEYYVLDGNCGYITSGSSITGIRNNYIFKVEGANGTVQSSNARYWIPLQAEYQSGGKVKLTELNLFTNTDPWNI